MTLLDDELPGLYIPYPKCGHCYEDIQMDVGVAWCENCRIKRDDISEDATPEFDPDFEGATVCGDMPIRPHDEYEHMGQWVTVDYHECILPEGHSSKHLHPHDYVSTPMEVAA